MLQLCENQPVAFSGLMLSWWSLSCNVPCHETGLACECWLYTVRRLLKLSASHVFLISAFPALTLNMSLGNMSLGLLLILDCFSASCLSVFRRTVIKMFSALDDNAVLVSSAPFIINCMICDSWASLNIEKTFAQSEQILNISSKILSRQCKDSKKPRL